VGSHAHDQVRVVFISVVIVVVVVVVIVVIVVIISITIAANIVGFVVAVAARHINTLATPSLPLSSSGNRRQCGSSDMTCDRFRSARGVLDFAIHSTLGREHWTRAGVAVRILHIRVWRRLGI
jgi:hypothetical protein